MLFAYYFFLKQTCNPFKAHSRAEFLDVLQISNRYSFLFVYLLPMTTSVPTVAPVAPHSSLSMSINL